MGSETPDAEGPLAAAIHETTNALTVILGWIERAQQTTDPVQARAALDRAAGHARMAREQMRRAIGAEAEPPRAESAHALAARALEDLAVEATRRGIILKLEAAALQEGTGNGGALVADPSSVWRIVTNLLLNSLAVTPPGGTVELSLSESRSSVCFRVSDDGPGVPGELRGRIFDGVSERPGGAGIGLKHAWAVARAAGGELRLVDGGRLAGACFELGWPHAGSEPARTARTPSSAPLEGMRVLLLEDDDAVVELLQLSLEARGAELTIVTDTARLDRELEAGGYDILLMDLSPLGGELDATVDKARRHGKNLTVVAISGSVTVQPRADVLWVRKPFSPSELTTAIVRERSRPIPEDP